MKIVLALCLSLWAVSVQAAQYWVRPTGTMSGCTASSTAPGADSGYKSTISAGLGCLSGGDTLTIRAGTYTTQLLIGSIPSGSSGSPTTVQSYQSELVTIRPSSGSPLAFQADGSNHSYITVKGSRVKGSTLTFDSSTSHAGNALAGGGGGNATALIERITIDGVEMKNVDGTSVLFTGPTCVSGGKTCHNPNDAQFSQIIYSFLHDNGNGTTGDIGPGHFYHGIYNSASNLTVDHTEIYNISGMGIQNYYPEYSPANNTFSNNYIHNTGQYTGPNGGSSAILANNGGGHKIFNNIIANNQQGISTNTTGNTIANNTVYGNGVNVSCNTGSGDWCFYAINDEGSGNTIKNNIVYNNNINTIQSTGTPTNNFFSNPLFVNAAGGDFHLQSNSLAIDGGVNLGAQYNTDIEGNARGFGAGWDIGAYEYTTGGGGGPPPELVVALSFDEGAGTTAADTSGLSNNATLTGGASWSANGKYGKALSVNGNPDSYATIAYAASLNLNPTGMTLEAWVNPSATVNTFRAVMTRDIDGPYYYLYAGSDSSYCSSLSSIGGFVTSADHSACNDTLLPVGQWTYLTVTYDGAAVRFYRNGVPINSVSATENLPTSSTRLLIGASFYDEFFTGLIDEVRVWSRARTQAEIKTDMNTPITPAAPVAPPGIVLNSGNSIKVYSGSVKVYVP